MKFMRATPATANRVEVNVTILALLPPPPRRKGWRQLTHVRSVSRHKEAQLGHCMADDLGTAARSALIVGVARGRRAAHRDDSTFLRGAPEGLAGDWLPDYAGPRRRSRSWYSARTRRRYWAYSFLPLAST